MATYYDNQLFICFLFYVDSMFTFGDMTVYNNVCQCYAF